ncbi:MAG: hypothetical protein M1833_005895 [Piccolia ochrophora]|nr:MAG: hypothetical protein M1833_005895 [Piccolia ochrophora]
MSTKEASRFIRRRAAGKSHDQFQPFSFKEDIRIHLYCSEAPCGDASMELIMAAQQDATPWPTTSQDDEEENPVAPLHGRGYFSKLGVVRRKPARSDAPPTLSKSCTDKLALKQSTSLLSSLTSLLISPENAYLHTLVLPASQYSAPACERAFGAAGRLRPLSGKRWPGSYSFRPFVMGTTKREFDFSGRGVNRLNEKRIPSNLSALWTPHLEETCINGGLQGRKQFHVKGASTICNRGMWTAVAKCISMVDHAALATLAGSMSTATYHALKCHEVLEHRRNVKSEVREKALQGWLQNLGDDFYTQ